MTSTLELSFNVEKSVCMSFGPRRTKQESLPLFVLNGVKMKIVQEYKYLAIAVSQELCNAEDTNRCESPFLKQFYGMYRKFDFDDPEIVIFLFQSYSSSLYACEMDRTRSL